MESSKMQTFQSSTTVLLILSAYGNALWGPYRTPCLLRCAGRVGTQRWAKWSRWACAMQSLPQHHIPHPYPDPDGLNMPMRGRERDDKKNGNELIRRYVTSISLYQFATYHEVFMWLEITLHPHLQFLPLPLIVDITGSRHPCIWQSSTNFGNFCFF